MVEASPYWSLSRNGWLEMIDVLGLIFVTPSNYLSGLPSDFESRITNVSYALLYPETRCSKMS
jgi:hypothetical protein